MPPKKRRGGLRGRCRGISNRRGPKSRQTSSPSTVTADDSDADGTYIDDNVSRSPRPIGKKPGDYNEERELSLPRLKRIAIPENATYLSMLNRDRIYEYVMTDDELDQVQWDLELMLISLIIRRNTVKDELTTFASMSFARSQQRMAKNSKLPTIRPRAAAEISPVNECRKMKVEFDPTSKELPPSKTESANRFWSLVEPYLAHVKKDDLNWLEDLVKSYSPNKNLYEIPPLGEHYSINWAKEELEMQKSQSSCSPRPSKRLKIAERISPDVVELVTKVHSAIHDGNVYTPIYQRVIAALIEHSHTTVEDLEDHFPEFDDEDNPEEMSNISKEFYAEQNVKKQLYKLGLMSSYSKSVQPSAETPPSLDKPDDDHDEILEEIIKCDTSLTQLREMNKNHLNELLERCRIDYYQQIIKNKIENVNKEIINFKRLQNETLAKEKKIIQTSEEDDDLNYLLDKRSNYLLQLQSIIFEPNSYFSPSASDNSEFSDEELEPFKVHIKTEPTDISEHEINVNHDDKTDYECNNENNFEDVQINIKQEIIDERMDCDEVNDDDGDLEFDEQIVDVDFIVKEVENVSNDINEPEKVIENKNEQDISVQQQVNINEEGEGTSSSIIEPTRGRHRKLKKSILENDQAFEIEARRPIRIKYEPDRYEPEIDSSETIIDGIKRELRSRKLNDASYFEPYNGTSSDESDFTDLSE